METIQEKIINGLIEFESSMSYLYSIFSKKYPKDQSFWKRLSDEEMKHSQILKKFKTLLSSDKDSFEEITALSIISLSINNSQLKSIINDFRNDKSREDALKTAIKLENCSVEEHYRIVLNSNHNDEIRKVFQILTKEDKLHYQRIVDYFFKQNIHI